MEKLTTGYWLLAVVLLLSSFAGAQTYIQSRSGGGTLAFSGNNAAGNTLIAVIGSEENGYNGNVVVTSVTDSKGNAWFPAGRLGGLPGSYQTGTADVWYAPNSVAGANTVTEHGNVGSAVTMVLLEYSGLDPVFPFETFASNISNYSGSPITSLGTNSVITGNAFDLLLVVGFSPQDTAQTFSTPSGTTQRENGNGMAVFDQVVSSTGTYNATISVGRATKYLYAGILALRSSPASQYFVQQNSNILANVRSITATYGKANSAGNSLLAFLLTDDCTVVDGHSCPPLSVVGTVNAWTLLGHAGGTSGYDVAVYEVPSTLAGTETVTATYFTPSGPFDYTDVTMLLLEYHGFSLVDAYAVNNGSSSPVSATVGATHAGELIVSAVVSHDSGHAG